MRSNIRPVNAVRMGMRLTIWLTYPAIVASVDRSATLARKHVVNVCVAHGHLRDFPNYMGGWGIKKIREPIRGGAASPFIICSVFNVFAHFDKKKTTDFVYTWDLQNMPPFPPNRHGLKKKRTRCIFVKNEIYIRMQDSSRRIVSNIM